MEKVSFDISREEELSETVRNFPLLYGKSHKGFKETDAVKNAWNGVATALEFNQTGNYFYVAPFIPVFETILFIWLIALVPGVSNTRCFPGIGNTGMFMGYKKRMLDTENTFLCGYNKRWKMGFLSWLDALIRSAACTSRSCNNASAKPNKFSL